MIDRRWRDARRVLAVRLDNLGDVLLTTPAIHALKASLPAAAITLLASPIGAQVGRLNPDLADVIEYEAPWVDPWCRLAHDSERERAMIETLRERQFDAAVIFTSFRQSALPAAYLCYLADIPLRLAASLDAPGSLLTTRHRHPERAMHEVERGLDLVGAVGCTAAERDLVLRVPLVARKRIARRIAAIVSPRWSTCQGRPCDGPDVAERKRGRTQNPPLHREFGASGYGERFVQEERRHPLIVVHSGCSMPARTAPPEQYAEVVTGLVDELGATIVLTGNEDERDLVATVAAGVAPPGRQAVVPVAGELPFAELCALIEAADLLVTNNTGPMHIAAAVKTPVVVLFALTNPPEQWGPWRVPHRLLSHDVRCRLCYSRVCPYDQECLRLVPTERVIAAATELLSDAITSQRQRPVGLASSGMGEA